MVSEVTKRLQSFGRRRLTLAVAARACQRQRGHGQNSAAFEPEHGTSFHRLHLSNARTYTNIRLGLGRCCASGVVMSSPEIDHGDAGRGPRTTSNHTLQFGLF